MTLPDARTIWLTVLGSEWVDYKEFMMHPQYDTLADVYVRLRDADALDKDLALQRVRIKCTS